MVAGMTVAGMTVAGMTKLHGKKYCASLKQPTYIFLVFSQLVLGVRQMKPKNSTISVYFLENSAVAGMT